MRFKSKKIRSKNFRKKIKRISLFELQNSPKALLFRARA